MQALALRFTVLLTVASAAAFADIINFDNLCPSPQVSGACSALASLETVASAADGTIATDFPAAPAQGTPQPASALPIGIGLLAVGLAGHLRKWRTGLLLLAAVVLPVSSSHAAVLTLTCPVAGGTVGVPYSSTVTAAGGVAPYRGFSLVNGKGTLPAGLTINAATGALTGTPTAEGSSSFTVTAMDSLVVGAGGQPNSGTANCTVKIVTMKLSITAVSFVSNITIYKDALPDPVAKTAGSIKQIANPMWTSSGTNERVGYAGGATMNVTLTLSVDSQPFANVPNVTIAGQMNDVGNLASKTFTIYATGSKTLTVSGIVAAKAFPAATKYYSANSFTIDWSYTVPGGPGAVSLGPTDHTVYVTLKKPVAKVYLTSIDIAVSKDGSKDEQTAFDQTWSFFAGPANTTNWAGGLLYYYKPNIPFSTCSGNFTALLTTGNGQCTTWAVLFRDALAVNGIKSSTVVITTKDGQNFLVKDWTYGAAAKATPDASHIYPMAFKTAKGEMVPPPATDKNGLGVYGVMTSEKTLAGQNTAPPAEKVFGSHYIVSYTPTGTDCTKNNCYFDPSYGATYLNQTDFQAKAVDGFLQQFPGNAANSGWVMKPAALDINFNGK